MAHTNIRVALFATMLLIAPLPALAQPGLNNEPWSPQATDPGTMAIAMAQMNGSDPSSPQPSQTLVCGGGAGSTATANSTCIILNNSTGSTVGTGQDSNGSQTATATSSTKTVSNTNTMSGALSTLVPGN